MPHSSKDSENSTELETHKRNRFDFSHDPKVLEVRKRILSSMNNGPSVSESAKYPTSTDSDGNVLTQKCYQVVKKNGACSKSGLDTEFKSASGRPLVKKVMPVLADSVNVDKDKAQRYMGRRRVILANQLSVHSKDTRENCDESVQNKHEKMNSGCESGNKREGWKADETLKNFEDNVLNIIEAEIMSRRTDIQWGDVSGLEPAKKALKEIIVLPFLRPDIFKGIRAPPKGVLLFGPPGTGKTMIGRCVASQCKATFFNIAASSITSKWVGEGEKLVRALFAIARVLQPSVVFIDEIDSLLTSRSESEHESSRRIKTEFLIHLDGVATTSDERILILGATNRPQELDSAVKRRFAKRLYIGLPCDAARIQMIKSLLSDQKHDLSNDDIQRIAKLTDGYSGADMKQLCSEAAMVPVRNIVDSSSLDIASISADDIRPISFSDFEAAMRFVRPTVVDKDLEGYQAWNKQYGSFLKEIDAELEVCTDLQRRNTLMDSHSDLMELIALLTENETISTTEQNLGETSSSVDSLDSGELIGMHCLAPYSRTVDRAIHFHDAVILDFVENSKEETDDIKVKVLYGHPLEVAMKPCEYFLNDRCSYGNQCRFSHGEEVLLSALQEYQKPDLSMVKEGSLILVQGENKLWSSARVTAIDNDKLAVCLLLTGKEIAVDQNKIYPIPQLDIDSKDETASEDLATTSWGEYREERCGNVTIGDIGDWEKHTRGIGMKLLLKMGYRAGEGLGRRSDGIVHAIQPVIFPKNKSLDACMEVKNKKVVDGIKSRQQHVKQTIAKRLKASEQPIDVFDLLNSKLNKAMEEQKDEIKEIEKLQNCSSTGLGVQALNLDKKLKELKDKERKLREGITRNQRDTATAERLKKNLLKCRNEMQQLLVRQQRVNDLMDSQRKKKDIF
uniref:Zinc finger CCCH-type with G patch domain-containing protein n=1 Tax=Setaria digitata TaxID=48799 RepID=A0A915PPT7_9BILA